MTPQAMNIAAAEECGWTDIKIRYLIEIKVLSGVCPRLKCVQALPDYYTSADAALELCEVARMEGFDVEISRFSFHTRDWFVTFQRGKDEYDARNQSLPAAITEAFLKWKGKL